MHELDTPQPNTKYTLRENPINRPLIFTLPLHV